MIAAVIVLIASIITIDYQVNFLHVNKQMETYANKFIEEVGLPPFGRIMRMLPIQDIQDPCERSLYYSFILTPSTCKKLREKGIVGFCLRTGESTELIIEVSTRYGYGSATFRQVLIHELAHCLYGVAHTEEGGPSNRLMRAMLNPTLSNKTIDKLEQDLVVWIRVNYYSLKHGEIK